MKNLEIIILAAGKGNRMGGDKPKVLTEINGKPMLSYILSEIEKTYSKKPTIVLGYKAEEVISHFGDDQKYVMQKEQLGTGHAVKEALPHIPPSAKHILVLYGDQPLVKSETIINLYKAHINQNTSPLTLGIVAVPDFMDWRKGFYDFGRIVRDAEGKIIKNTEKKDATPKELEIKEVNPSYYCFNYEWLLENISKIDKKNASGEYYLTDLVNIAQSQGYELNSHLIPAHEALGVNTPEQLELVIKFIK
jgi:bifunctional UDP-N-acetylglucosamine pyrophosphorylase/glucosamine-1-phosphate N-acetyltransferase